MFRKSSIVPSNEDEYEQMGAVNEKPQRITNVFSKVKNLLLDFNWHQNKNGNAVETIRKQARLDKKIKRLRVRSRVMLRFNDRPEELIDIGNLIHPESTNKLKWDMFIMFLVFYYGFTTPVNIGFTKTPFDIFFLELVFNFFFVIDIMFNFVTPYRHVQGPEVGRLEVDLDKIAKKYIGSWFIIDVVASIPMDLIYEISSGGTRRASGAGAVKILKMCRGVKFFRVCRVGRIFDKVTSKMPTSVARITKLVFLMLMLWHLIGCLYWGLAENIGLGANIWTPRAETKDMSFIRQYIRSLLWAVTVTTGIGRDIEPQSSVEGVFTAVSIILGLLMYAIITGSFSSLLQEIDSMDGKRRRNINQIQDYLRQRECNETLVKKIIDYYEYCHDRHITGHDEALLSEMHSSLKEELDLGLNKRLLKSIPRFQSIGLKCLLCMIKQLKSRVYLPQEIIFFIRERAEDMFFVARGDTEVLDGNFKRVDVFSDGDFFGDEVIRVEGRRESTVRSITYSELLVLRKKCLKIIISRHADFALHIASWSGLYSDRTEYKWKRVSYTIRLLRLLKHFGAKFTFLELCDALNGKNLEKSKKDYKMTLTISHKQFKDEYGYT